MDYSSARLKCFDFVNTVSVIWQGVASIIEMVETYKMVTRAELLQEASTLKRIGVTWLQTLPSVLMNLYCMCRKV